jgi:hypothetical protein
VRKEGGLTMASLVHWLKQVDPEHPLLGQMKTEFREKRKAEEKAEEERARKESRVIDEDDDNSDRMKDGYDPELEEQSFEKVAAHFEQRHCKIVNLTRFFKEADESDNSENQIFKLVPFKRQDLLTNYENLFYQRKKLRKDKKTDQEIIEYEERNFVKDWLKWPKMRTDQDVRCLPKGCPPNMFNLWRPFDVQLLHPIDPTVEDFTEEIEFVRNHVKILCSHDMAVTEYMMKWFAHMFLANAPRSSLANVQHSFPPNRALARLPLSTSLTK